MRTALWGILVASSALAGWLSLGAGCGALPTDCKETFTCAPGAGGSGGATSSSSSSGVGGDSGPPVECTPAAGKDPVADTCGLFVSSSHGDDASPTAGTKKTPYKTLAAAVVAAGKKKTRVYACAEAFTEAVTIAAATGVYGGLDCTKDWAYTEGAKSTLTAAVDAVPLTMSASAQLSDFKVKAQDATADGGSSIAVIVGKVTASFTRCDLSAGNGVKGLDGVTPPDSAGPTASNDPLIRGNDGSNACTTTGTVNGGDPKENTFCALANNPLGGYGGPGLPQFGGNATAIPADDQTALGGIGQLTSNPAWGCFAGSGLGDGGANGAAGMDGAGAIGDSALGQLSLTGYIGAPGMPGVAGKPGQGGGGGGGAKGKII